MERVILLGTTAGTTWRIGLIERLVARGVSPERIINPHVSGVPYTKERMMREEEYQEDPETLIVIVIRPGVLKRSWLRRILWFMPVKKSELLGPISMVEIGRFCWSEPGRTAVFLDMEQFTPGKRPRKVLGKIARQLEAIGTPPYFATMPELENWIVERLTAQP